MVFSWEMAEELAAAHMRSLGFTDVRRTTAGADQGIDVVAVEAVAQVKFLQSPVGGPDIQRFRGAAHRVPNALFYSSSGYTKAALAAADHLNIALFQFDAQNHLHALNGVAEVAAAPPTPDPGSPEQSAVDELLEAVLLRRFRVRTWQRVCARGRTQYWLHQVNPPDAKDLLLPATLDKLPLGEAEKLVLAVRPQIYQTALSLMKIGHATQNRWHIRRWEDAVGDLAAYRAKHPDASMPDFPAVPIPELQRQTRVAGYQLDQSVQQLLDAKHEPDVLRWEALREARYLIEEEDSDFGHYSASQALPAI